MHKTDQVNSCLFEAHENNFTVQHTMLDFLLIFLQEKAGSMHCQGLQAC